MVPFLKPHEIENEVDRFLEKYHSSREIPIPVDDIVEFTLNIEIVTIPGLMNRFNIDGFLSKDWAQLSIDQDIYMDRPTRSRFTFAHELGHFWLHKDYVDNLDIKSRDYWKEVKLTQQNESHAKMETQANMFAARLLMPKAETLKEFDKVKAETLMRPEFKNVTAPDDETLAAYLARTIARTFDVSEETMRNRLSWLVSDS